MAPASLGLRPGRKEQGADPGLQAVDDCVVAIVLLGVGGAGSFPVAFEQEKVAQDASVAQGEREALAEGWVTRCRRVADQGDAVAMGCSTQES